MNKVKIGLITIYFAIGLLLSGCGSNNNNIDVPSVKSTKKFQFSKIKLNLSQSSTSKIVYHTEEELSEIINNRLLELMKQENMLSTDELANKLIIKAFYYRRFVGDQTPFPSDSLAYPNYDYEIEVVNKEKKIEEIKRENLAFKGGFAYNLKVIAGTLRDKKYEIDFAQALANKIFEEIKSL